MERANEDGVRFSLGDKKTTPETESVQNEHQPSVVSSVDGAKVINELDNTIKVYDENDIKRSNTFIGDLAKALNAKRDGSNSEYATFEAVNGKVFTIRLSEETDNILTSIEQRNSEAYNSATRVELPEAVTSMEIERNKKMEQTLFRFDKDFASMEALQNAMRQIELYKYNQNGSLSEAYKGLYDSMNELHNLIQTKRK